MSGTGSRLRCSGGGGDAGRKILKRAALIAGAINSAPLKSASLGHLSCRNKKGVYIIKRIGAPIGAPHPASAAAAAAVVSRTAATAAIAEQQDQNDDPPPVVVQAAANTVIIVAHKIYLRDFC